VPPELSFEVTPVAERKIVQIQAMMRGKSVRTPPGMPAPVGSSSEEEEDDDDVPASAAAVEEEAAAVAIQARVRGRQARRAAAAQRLSTQHSGSQLMREGGGPQDLDVSVWLTEQNAADLIEEIKHEFGATTLRDLIAIVQEPLDWSIFVPDDDLRCKALWESLQKARGDARGATSEEKAGDDDDDSDSDSDGMIAMLKARRAQRTR
jgi:hypothetical protein